MLLRRSDPRWVRLLTWGYLKTRFADLVLGRVHSKCGPTNNRIAKGHSHKRVSSLDSDHYCSSHFNNYWPRPCSYYGARENGMKLPTTFTKINYYLNSLLFTLNIKMLWIEFHSSTRASLLSWPEIYVWQRIRSRFLTLLFCRLKKVLLVLC